MTIEEFREFGWKAGMRMKFAESDTDSYDIVRVDFNNDRAWIDGGWFSAGRNIPLAFIDVILNPDGTVAWRRE